MLRSQLLSPLSADYHRGVLHPEAAAGYLDVKQQQQLQKGYAKQAAASQQQQPQQQQQQRSAAGATAGGRAAAGAPTGFNSQSMVAAAGGQQGNMDVGYNPQVCVHQHDNQPTITLTGSTLSPPFFLDE